MFFYVYPLGCNFFTPGEETTRLVGVIIYLRPQRFLGKIGKFLPQNTQMLDL